MTLKFAEQQTELLREASESGGGAEDFQFALLLHEQGAQNHNATFLAEHFAGGDAEIAQDKTGKPFKRQDVQSCGAVEFRVG